ncbi:MAG: hypothetical protein ACK4PR_13485, partial [Gammaproteobacteria bacterium]
MQLKVIGAKGKAELVPIQGSAVYTAYAGDLLVLVDAKHPSFLSINNQDLLISDQDGDSVLVKDFFSAGNTADGPASLSVNDNIYTASQIVSSIEYNSSETVTKNAASIHPFQLPTSVNNETNGFAPGQGQAPLTSPISPPSSANMVNAMLATTHTTPTSTTTPTPALVPTPVTVNHIPIA